eukprot:1924920-Prymnesium_polylepis.1
MLTRGQRSPAARRAHARTHTRSRASCPRRLRSPMCVVRVQQRPCACTRAHCRPLAPRAS